jgi:hypothetical protein
MNALSIFIENGAVTLLAGMRNSFPRFIGDGGVMGSVTVGADGRFQVALRQRPAVRIIQGRFIFGFVAARTARIFFKPIFPKRFGSYRFMGKFHIHMAIHTG